MATMRVSILLLLSYLTLSSATFKAFPSEQFKKVYYTDDGSTWDFDQAQKYCIDLGATIVTPRTQAEFELIRDFKASTWFRIGAKLSMEAKISNVYLDGSPVTIAWDDQSYRKNDNSLCYALAGHTSFKNALYQPCAGSYSLVICESPLVTTVVQTEIDRLKSQLSQLQEKEKDWTKSVQVTKNTVQSLHSKIVIINKLTDELHYERQRNKNLVIKSDQCQTDLSQC